MLVKVYNWLITLFYFYLTFRGVSLIFFESENKRHKNIIYQYGLENRNKYLSIWVSFLQTLYFILVSMADIIESFPSIFKCPQWSQNFNNITSYLLTTLVLPLTLYIFVVFWSFYLYDREMIYPELFDRIIPPWLNLAMHFYPVPILIVHLIVSRNHNPEGRSALVGLTALFGVYGVIFGSAVMKGNWIYLLFNHLSPSQRMFLVSMSYPVTVLFLILSRWLNNSIGNFKKRYLVKTSKKY